jgi:Protein of unknown function (DUF3085)
MINIRARSMKLHFPWAEVSKALGELRTAPGIRTLYGTTTGPGLWLVGDQGVYLMPNTTATKRTIVYARECDPTKLDFETWWANKDASFGGDDGVEFIYLNDIDELVGVYGTTNREPRYLRIEISPEKFSLAIL